MKKYKLRIQIGKKPVSSGLKKRVYRFETNDPVAALLSIKIPKMMEEVFFTVEKDGKTATCSRGAFRARRIFTNKLNASYLIKQMEWLMK